MPRAIAAFSVFFLSLLLVGCVTPQKVESPTVQLQNVKLLKARGLMQMVRVDLLVSNPNDFDIPLTGLQFNMEVNGVAFAEGLSNSRVDIPRLGRATVPVEVWIKGLTVVRQLQAVRKTKKLDYHLSGKALLDHVLLPSVTFDRRGSVAFRNDGSGMRFHALES
jgi:LEA14-like dessication related protein